MTPRPSGNYPTEVDSDFMKTPPLRSAGLVVCVAFLSTARLSAAISLSSIDTFATTSESWVEGAASPNPPVRNVGVGRDGVSPGHLVNLSDGSSAGGRLVMWTTSSDWVGNYVSASVSGLEFWADNRSGNVSIINLRIAFDGPGGWVVSDSRAVSDTVAGNEWTKLAFSLVSSDFTWIASSGGTGNFSEGMPVPFERDFAGFEPGHLQHVGYQFGPFLRSFINATGEGLTFLQREPFASCGQTGRGPSNDGEGGT